MLIGKDSIICGDTLQILKTIPDNLFDMGITSPPYNKGEKDKGWLVDKVEYLSSRDDKPENEYQKEQIEVLNEIYRVTKPDGSFFYNHKVRYKGGNILHPLSWLSQTKWNIRQEIIWNRKLAANIRGWRFWLTEERIYWLTKPGRYGKIGKELASRHALLTSIWEIPPEKENKHPAPFPIEIPVRCIYSILDGQTGYVLDPYCGSGTTLLAAHLLGSNYFGIDISKEYLSGIEERINNTIPGTKEYNRLEKEVSLHKVKLSFKERKKGK